MADGAAQLDFFPSLDFPGRTTLTLGEIAERLGCTVQHLFNQTETGELVGLDLKSKAVSRQMLRVPVECYREYVMRRVTGSVDMRMQFLRDLPAATRRQLIKELQDSLKKNP